MASIENSSRGQMRSGAHVDLKKGLYKRGGVRHGKLDIFVYRFQKQGVSKSPRTYLITAFLVKGTKKK